MGPRYTKQKKHNIFDLILPAPASRHAQIEFLPPRRHLPPQPALAGLLRQRDLCGPRRLGTEGVRETVQTKKLINKIKETKKTVRYRNRNEKHGEIRDEQLPWCSTRAFETLVTEHHASSMEKYMVCVLAWCSVRREISTASLPSRASVRALIRSKATVTESGISHEINPLLQPVSRESRTGTERMRRLASAWSKTSKVTRSWTNYGYWWCQL